jgi:hypothetical protein
MAIQGIGAVVGLAWSAIMCRASGMWQAIRAYIEGRNAVNLEKERRITLLTVPLALPPGTEVCDLRADGSLLQLRVPPIMWLDATPGGHTEQSTSLALPPVGPADQDPADGPTDTAAAAEE